MKWGNINFFPLYNEFHSHFIYRISNSNLHLQALLNTWGCGVLNLWYFKWYCYISIFKFYYILTGQTATPLLNGWVGKSDPLYQNESTYSTLFSVGQWREAGWLILPPLITHTWIHSSMWWYFWDIWRIHLSEWEGGVAFYEKPGQSFMTFMKTKVCVGPSDMCSLCRSLHKFKGIMHMLVSTSLFWSRVIHFADKFVTSLYYMLNQIYRIFFLV